jgi:hypothetical protein
LGVKGAVIQRQLSRHHSFQPVKEDSMRELTDVELDAVGGGFLNHAKGNGGVGANIFQKNTVHQHAEVEEAHDVVLVQAASQSNSIGISNTKS